MKAEYLGSVHEVQGTAATDLNSGDVIVAADGRVAIVTALTGFKQGRQYRATTTGRFRVNCLTTATFTAANRPIVYWDVTNQRATNSASGNVPMGRAAADKSSGPATVEVLLGDCDVKAIDNP